MATGQCKVDPVTGIAGDIYDALKADGDHGMVKGPNGVFDLLVPGESSGSTLRKLFGALVAAIAASITGGSSNGLGNNNPPPVSTTSSGGDGTHTLDFYTPAAGEVGTVTAMLAAKKTNGSLAVSSSMQLASYRSDGTTVTITNQSGHDENFAAPDGDHLWQSHIVADGANLAMQFDGVGATDITWTFTFAVTKA